MRALGDIAQALVGHILAQNIGPDELVFENDSITGDELIALADAQHPATCAACGGPWASSLGCDQCLVVLAVRESRETEATIGHGPDCPDDCNAFRGEVPDGAAR